MFRIYRYKIFAVILKLWRTRENIKNEEVLGRTKWIRKSWETSRTKTVQLLLYQSNDQKHLNENTEAEWVLRMTRRFREFWLNFRGFWYWPLHSNYERPEKIIKINESWQGLNGLESRWGLNNWSEIFQGPKLFNFFHFQSNDQGHSKENTEAEWVLRFWELWLNFSGF